MRADRIRRAAAAAGVCFAAVLLVASAWIAWPLPRSVSHPAPVTSVALQDRDGAPLRTTRAPDGSRAGWLRLGDVDPELLQAFITAEDARFFEHHGVDVRSTARAVRDNLRERRVVSGASTITMQTARLLGRTGKRGYTGKLRQALWALRLESHLDKHAILEQYLNRVPLGQGTVGVQAAAALYFGASASELSLGQAALLAGLARAPSRDNPLVSPERAASRRRMVLARLHERGQATTADVERAQLEPVATPGARTVFAAPHFTTRVLTWAERDEAVTSGAVRTTLDLELQRAVEAEVRYAVRSLTDRGARHAAAVVLDNASGAILAWVGSPDFFAERGGQVDMVTAARQPGSTLKPFLYGAAFDRGYTAATVLPDVPRVFPTSAGGYTPQNYDRRFRGPVRIREALASSYNVPAVELAQRIGPAALLETLHAAGFASLRRSAEHYGLGLALGNGEVTLLELANAYRGIANGGVQTDVAWKLEDEQQARMRWSEMRRRRQPEGRFLSAGAAALLLDILSDPVARIPGFGEATALDFPFPVAAKTGTSRHFTDNWAVAVTGQFTVAVWVGNFSGEPMRAVSGISGAGPLLHRVVLESAKRYPPGRLPSPEVVGAVQAPVCRLSGMAATPHCQSLIEWFLPGTEPSAPDHWEPDGSMTLPDEYAEWNASGGTAGRTHVLAAQSGERSGASARRILSPLDGDEYEIPPGVEARYATIPLLAGGADATAVRWSVDGAPVPSARWQLGPGAHVVRAQWPDGELQAVRIIVR